MRVGWVVFLDYHLSFSSLFLIDRIPSQRVVKTTTLIYPGLQLNRFKDVSVRWQTVLILTRLLFRNIFIWAGTYRNGLLVVFSTFWHIKKKFLPIYQPSWDDLHWSKIITIHHECPCRIGKSHPRGRNFYQGRGFPRPWLKFRPRGWDLPILHGLAHDGLFFSHF